MSKKKKIFIISFWSIVALLVLGFVGTSIYVNDYYTAKDNEIDEGITNVQIKYEADSVEFIPGEIKAALIFYPGGKVEYTAYNPLMQSLASEGILVIVPHMTFNLAFMEINAATGIRTRYPDVDDWYIGGHSLGGVGASYYLKRHVSDYKGLILMASYSTSNFSKTDLKCLSLYGDCDKVLKMKSYEKNKKNLSNLTEVVIEGGCHSYFGNYGDQKGDGTPTITRLEQQTIVKNEIVKYMNI